MLSMEDWAEIRRLHRAEGVSIKEIARGTGLARNTVRRAGDRERSAVAPAGDAVLALSTVLALMLSFVTEGAVRNLRSL